MASWEAIRKALQPSQKDFGADLLPLGGLFLATLTLFSRIVIGGDVLFQRDIHSVFYAQAENFARGVLGGSLPLWDPYPAFGGPVLADPLYQTAYPLTWLNLVLRPAQFYKVYALVHVLAGGTGIYALSRRFGASRLPAFAGGVAALLSGPFLSAVSLWHHFAGASWIPWVLLALDHVASQPSLRGTLILALTFAGQILAGSGDMCLITGFLGVTYLLVVRPRLGGVSGLGLALVLALGLSAIQWVPTLGILPAGARLQLTSAAKLSWSVHPLSLLDLLVPRLISDFPMSQWVRDRLFDSREPFLSCLYLGPGALVMAVLGGILPDRRGAFVLFSFLLLVYASLGRHVLFVPLLFQLPGVSIFRYPTKCLLPAGLLLGLLVARGFETWLRPWTLRERRVASACVLASFSLAGSALFAMNRVPVWASSGIARAGASLEPTVISLEHAAVVAAGIGLVFGLRVLSAEPRWTLLMLLVVSGDLWLVGRGINPTAPGEFATNVPPVARAMERGSRYYSLPDDLGFLNETLSRAPSGWGREAGFALGFDEVVGAPSGGRYGLYGSFDGDTTGLRPRELLEFSSCLYAIRGFPVSVKLLQMGGVQYVVALHETSFPGLETLMEVPSFFSEPIRLFAVPAPLPRGYFVRGSRHVPPSRVISTILEPSFDPRTEVVLEGEGSDEAPGLPSGDVRFIFRRADALGLEAQAKEPGYVVLLEAFDRGWKAWVDGRRVPILKVNGLFRGVRVGEGVHHVEMRYRPVTASLGAAVSFLSALLTGLLLCGGIRHPIGAA